MRASSRIVAAAVMLRAVAGRSQAGRSKRAKRIGVQAARRYRW